MPAAAKTTASKKAENAIKASLKSKLKFRPWEIVKIAERKFGRKKDQTLPKVVQKLYKDVKFKIRKSVDEDMRSRSHGDNYILKKMFNDRPYEKAHNRYQKDATLPKEVQGTDLFKDRKILDLGANIGTFTVQAAVNGAKDVLSYEPDVETFRTLKENIKINAKSGICKAVQAAVSADGKDAVMLTKVDKNKTDRAKDLDYRPNRSNRNSIIADSLNFVSTGEKIKTEKLEQIMKKFKPEVVKVDIEGAEIQIVRNLAKMKKSDFCSLFGCTKEFMVYYHLDKDEGKKVKNFSEFLTNLKKLFRFVKPVYTPMVPDPAAGWDWQMEVKTNPDLPWKDKKDLGQAAACQDILVYCAVVKK